MASALMELKKLKKDFTRCSVCFNIYCQPKMLPCLHTFCLQCLEDCRVMKSPDVVSCPLCRGEMPQTENGLKSLPTNFLITRLLEMKLLTGENESKEVCYCDPCQEGATGDVPVAEMYCVECHEKLCESCVAAHRKMKLSKTHQLIQLGPDNVEQLDQVMKSNRIKCESHPEERIGFYCMNCSVAICMKCCVLQHKDHKYKDISEVADIFKTGLASIIETVTANIATFKQSSAELARQSQKLTDKTKHVELLLEQRASMLQEEIEKRKAEVLLQMNDHKMKKFEEINVLNLDVEGKLEALETFKEFCQQLRDKGTNFDITRSSAQFIARAKVLQDMSADAAAVPDIGFTFKAGTTDANVTDKTTELYGIIAPKIDPKKNAKSIPGKKIPTMSSQTSSESQQETLPKDQARYRDPNKPYPPKKPHQKRPTEEPSQANYPPASLVSVIPGVGAIQGITMLNQKLFVARHATPFVEIYDIANDVITVESMKQQQVPGLTNTTDMTSDPLNGLVFIGDWSSSSVLRLSYNKNGNVSIGKFQTSGRPNGLSVTSQSNVLVACTAECQIQEYSLNGVALRTLSTYMHKPRHAIEISFNQYVFSSGDIEMADLVSKFSVDESGKINIYKQFGGEKVTNPKHKLNVPSHLVLDPLTKNILVADSQNNRVIALRSDNLFTFGPNLIGKQRIKKPTRLCLGPVGSGSIYVGSTAGELVKFKISCGEAQK